MQEELDSMLSQAGISELEQQMRAMFPGNTLSFEELLGLLLRGELHRCYERIQEELVRMACGSLEGLRTIFISLLLVGISAALWRCLADAFRGKQIGELGFYFLYLFQVMLLFPCFEEVAEVSKTVINQIVLFMKLFLPTYLWIVGLASGATTAGILYQLLLFLFGIIQIGAAHVIVPMIYVYVFLNVVNGLWMEERLILLMDGCKKLVQFLCKAVTTLLLGASLVQSMITPVIDSVRGLAVQKAIRMVPGLGGIAEGVSQMVVGSAVLIKNSVGMGMLLLLLVICFAPICRIFCIAVMLKGTAALLGVLAEKRMADCTDRMGEGCLLFVRMLSVALLLFFITIAIAAYTTNRGFS